MGHGSRKSGVYKLKKKKNANSDFRNSPWRYYSLMNAVIILLSLSLTFIHSFWEYRDARGLHHTFWMVAWILFNLEWKPQRPPKFLKTALLLSISWENKNLYFLYPDKHTSVIWVVYKKKQTFTHPKYPQRAPMSHCTRHTGVVNGVPGR